jgi:transcription elongation factor Elf1
MALLGTYRCPVCGHRDTVEVAAETAARVTCSYCTSVLEVRARGTDNVSLTARLAGTPVHG